MSPFAHQRHCFKARWGGWKAGHGLAVVHMLQPSLAEVAADLAVFQRHGRRKGATACGQARRRWAQNRRSHRATKAQGWLAARAAGAVAAVVGDVAQGSRCGMRHPNGRPIA